MTLKDDEQILQINEKFSELEFQQSAYGCLGYRYLCETLTLVEQHYASLIFKMILNNAAALSLFLFSLQYNFAMIFAIVNASQRP